MIFRDFESTFKHGIKKSKHEDYEHQRLKCQQVACLRKRFVSPQITQMEQKQRKKHHPLTHSQAGLSIPYMDYWVSLRRATKEIQSFQCPYAPQASIFLSTTQSASPISWSWHNRAMMCLMEEMLVLDKLHLGRSYSPTHHEFEVNESTPHIK